MESSDARGQGRCQNNKDSQIETVSQVTDDGLQQRRALEEDGEQTGLGLGEGELFDEDRQQRRQERAVGVVNRVSGGNSGDLGGLRGMRRIGTEFTHATATVSKLDDRVFRRPSSDADFRRAEPPLDI